MSQSCCNVPTQTTFLTYLFLLWQVQFWRSKDRPIFSAALPVLLVGAKGSCYIEKLKCTKEAMDFVIEAWHSLFFLSACKINPLSGFELRLDCGLNQRCTDCSHSWESCLRGFLSYSLETSTLQSAHVSDKQCREHLTKKSARVWRLSPS